MIVPARHLAALGLALLVGVLPLTSCTDEPATTPPEPECSETKACAGGLVCQSGACVPCRRDRECALDELCHPIRRRCELRPCYGHDCKVHDDCELGLFCVQGLCLRPGVTTAEGCQVISCAEGEACNEGQRCNTANLVCEEDLGCTADTDCAEGEACNVAAGRCEAACTAETAAAICGVKKVCNAGRCVDCVTNADCGGGLQCNLETNVCESLTSCLSNRDCEAPLVCNHVTKQCTVDPGPCLSAEDCASDETCQLATGRCVPASCLADRFEPNDTITAGKPLVMGSTPNLTLCRGDADVFKVALGRGDRIQVVVDVDPLLDFEISILDATGAELDTGDLAADAVASVAGDHFVRARSQDAYVRYGLRATVARGVPCDADPEEPNEAFQAAAALPLGDSFGKTICPGDADWFAVSVAPGQQVEVSLGSAPLDGPLEIALFDSTGVKQLATSATSAELQTVRAIPLGGSRVYVRVKGVSPSVQNKYDLAVSVRAP